MLLGGTSLEFIMCKNKNENKKAKVIKRHLKAEASCSLGCLRKYRNTVYIFNTEQIFFLNIS